MLRLSAILILGVLGPCLAARTPLGRSPAATTTPTPASAPGTAMTLVLPTDNDAIFRNDGPAFYMYVDRDFEKVRSTPWEGGQYGFVRGPVKFADRMVLMSF